MKIPFTALFTLTLISISSFGFSQTSTTQIKNSYDSTFGFNNLGYNNGILHINLDRSENKTSRYFSTDKYQSGSFNYDHQHYDNASLKYDLFDDVLIAKVSGENNTTGINLIKAKTQSFEIDGKVFVNLNYQSKVLPEFITGFYEIFTVNQNLVLYIKYLKKQNEVININGKFQNYVPDFTFVILQNSVYHTINSQNDFAKLFKGKESEINEFYELNRDSRKNDPSQYMKNLIVFTSNLYSKGN